MLTKESLWRKEVFEFIKSVGEIGLDDAVEYKSIVNYSGNDEKLWKLYQLIEEESGYSRLEYYLTFLEVAEEHSYLD